MSPERPREDAPYWTSDEAIGEVRFWGEPWALRLAVHTADEPYQRGHAELVPLTAAHGNRTYVQAQPYILVPDLRLTVDLSPTPGDAIGQVRESTWQGMKSQPVGTAQAWFYREDQVLIFWECFFEDRYQTSEPPDDPNLRILWEGFERFLLGRFPAARQLVTTAADPLYDVTEYQRFLADLGYERLSDQAFGKRLRP